MAKSKKNILGKYGLDESDHSISTPGDASSRSTNPKKTKKKVTKKSVKRKVKKAGRKVRKAAKTTAGRAGVGAAAGSIAGPVGAVAGAVIGVVTKPKRKPRRKKNPGPTVKMSTAMGNLMLDYHRASENVEHVAASALRGERVELRYVKKARTDLKKIQAIQPKASEKEQIGELVDALDRIIKKAGAIGNPARAFSLEAQVKRGRQSKAKKAAGRSTSANKAASSVAAASLRKRMAKINPGTYKQQLPKMSVDALDTEHKAISSLITRARKAPGAGKMVTDLTKVRGYIVAEKKARRSKGHRTLVSNPEPRLSSLSKRELKDKYPTLTKMSQRYIRARNRYQTLLTSPGNSSAEIARAEKAFKGSEQELSLFAEVKGISLNQLESIVRHMETKRPTSPRRRSNPLTKVTERMSDRRFRDVVSRNISAEMKAGKPQKQAVAIALNQARSDAPKKSRSLYGARPNPSRIDPDTGHVLPTRKATRKKSSKKKSSKKATTKKTRRK